MRVCVRNGWRLAEWYALDDREQIEWLADDLLRQRSAQALLDNLSHPEHGILDVTAYCNLIMSMV